VSYRNRLLVAVAGAVAAAVALASAGAYVVTRAQLRSGIDDSLRRLVQRADLADPESRDLLRALEPGLGGENSTLQIVSASGETTTRIPSGRPALPVGGAVTAVARGERGDFLYDTEVQDVHLRVMVAGLRSGEAAQIARPLTETDDALRGLATVTAAIGAIGVLGALLAGLVLARTLLRPVRRLTEAAEHVSRTQNLNAEIEARGEDELARLARAFNAMLRALSASRQAQRQLVADASHELRTPLTILRTNLEMLASDEEFRAHDRTALLSALARQSEELGELVNDLVELARDGLERRERVPVRLDLLAHATVTQARERWPGTPIAATLEPTELDGAPEMLQRAIRNLVDNAIKWGSPDGPIEVTLRDRRLTVRDHGPGIDPADLPRIFDRFYRSAGDRAKPGSGLGLAIVRHAAEAHGGSAYAENAPDGGARLTIDLARAD
jgi:two-component system sensor histidine kinase MprB